MIICHKCKQVMTCLHNGAEYHFGNGHCYAADVFECRSCGNQTSATNTNAHRVLPENLPGLKERKGTFFVEMQP